MVTYIYSVINDFLGTVNLSKLDQEIRNSAIVTALDCINGNGDVISIIFKDTLSNTDKTILDNNTTSPAGGLIAAHDHTPNTTPDTIPISFPSEFLNSEGNLKVVPLFQVGDKLNLVSPNWCDKTTWYESSIQVQDETLEVIDTDGKVYKAHYDFWIDLSHGKVTQEDNILASNSNKWLPIIKVDGIVKIEDNFESDTQDGDFYINYATGEVHFHNPINGVVTASYYYATTGSFTIKPPSNKKYEITRIEVQFSKNLVLNDTIEFQAYGYAGVFAPQLGYPPTTLIPLGTKFRYKHAFDFINESNGVYPEVSLFGGFKRGFTQPIIILPWSYITKTELIGTYGMQIVVSVKNNKPMTGELATATFYCVEHL